MKFEELSTILPHRFPFLLVDKIIEIDPEPEGSSWVGRKAVAIKNVTINEPFFPGHFPNRPIMPGVLIIEAMAQVSAVVAYRPPTPGLPQDVAFAAADNARFRLPVEPGDTLRIVSEIKKDKAPIFKFHCQAFVEDKLVAEADILAKAIFTGGGK